jgi:hypothetical protein
MRVTPDAFGGTEVPHESISENLELLLHDRALANAGYTIELYCDASDVVRAVHGMRAYFYNDPDDATSRLDVKVREFNKANALVAALLAHGDLGPFRLLPPHQAEFLRNLDGFTDYLDWSPQTEEAIREVFLDAVGLRTREKRPRIAQLAGAQLEKFVDRYVGQAYLFFQALQCISHTWWERLEEWTQKSLLCTSTSTLNYSAVAEHEDFRRVLHLFEELRPRAIVQNAAERVRRTELNSFMDSVVLLALSQLNEDKKKKKRVVRFYDSTGLFRRVAAQAGLTDRLRTPLPSGAIAQTTPVLIGSRYLVYRAAVSGHAQTNKRGGDVVSLDERDVQMLEEELAEFSGGRERLPIEKLDEMLLTKRLQLGPVMRKLITYSFFDHLWLPQLAAKEIQQLRDRLAISKQDVDSDPFRQKYQEIVSRARTAFERNAAEIGRLRAIWITCEDSLKPLWEEVENQRLNPARDFKPVRDLDLVRFELPPDVQAFVDDFVTDLIDLGQDFMHITRRRVWHKFVVWCHDGRKNREEALRAATLLWLMGATTSLIEHFGWVVRSDASPTLRVMYAAALLNTGTDVATAGRITRGLEKEFGLPCATAPRAKEKLREHLGLAIELAYLHFHAWLAMGAKPYWRGVDSLPPYPHDTSELALVDSAICYADYALECMNLLGGDRLKLDEELESKRTYILNQRLYYRVEQGNPKRLEEMREARKELMESENPPRYWDYTYYDTLARFYEFEGISAKTVEAKKICFARALDRATMAVKKGPDHVTTEKHRTVRDYLDHISAEWTRRFE